MINAYIKMGQYARLFPDTHNHMMIHATVPSARARFAPIETRGDETFRKRVQNRLQQFKQQNMVI